MGFDNVPTLSGLFYIISTKDEKCGYLETVLSWNHFWGNALQQPSFTPFTYNANNVFEYLEMFEVDDRTFNIHCKNNNMDLKLWEKKENSFKELLNIPIKLHPFFDTFSDSKIAGQFYKEEMPVVSCTDWVDVSIGSAMNPILSAKIKVALAIGTSDQLDTFKASKNITVLPFTTSRSNNPITKKANPTALADMLNTFIDNLASSLPKRTESDPRPQQHPTDPRYQLRRTSDLLDVLHNALKNPTPVSFITSSSALPFKLSGRNVNLPTNGRSIEATVRVLVNIDSARNLVMRGNNQGDKLCTYVSFEAIDCDDDGQYTTFATKVTQNSCKPNWNEKFNVMLPVDLMQKENDRKFILKIWRKLSAHDRSQGSKHAYQDEVIGVAAIDLSSLSSASTVSGHYNLIDNAGHVSGQIKINIVRTDGTNNTQESTKLSSDQAELPNNFKDLENVDNVILSRTLKRKFTELEEISQRLKSRLLDVTADDNFDVDDEFENDLNTCPDEEDMDVGSAFDWNRFSTLEIDCDGNALSTNSGTVDDGFLSNALQPSVVGISNVVDSNNHLPADENLWMNVQTDE